MNERGAPPMFLSAFLWSAATSPFEAVVVLLGPTIGTINLTLAAMYLYVPGMALLKPVFDAIPYGGWVPTLVHVSLAMFVQNFTIWAAFLWWQNRQVHSREI